MGGKDLFHALGEYGQHSIELLEVIVEESFPLKPADRKIQLFGAVVLSFEGFLLLLQHQQ